MWLNPAQTATLQLMFDTLMQSLSMVFEICWKWRGHSMKIKGWTSLKCSQSSLNSFLSHAKSKLMGWILVNVHPLVLNRYGLILLNMLPCCWCSYSHSSLTSESWTRVTGSDLICKLYYQSFKRAGIWVSDSGVRATTPILTKIAVHGGFGPKPT